MKRLFFVLTLLALPILAACTAAAPATENTASGDGPIVTVYKPPA